MISGKAFSVNKKNTYTTGIKQYNMKSKVVLYILGKEYIVSQFFLLQQFLKVMYLNFAWANSSTAAG